jgi:hypothetical protein
MPYSNPNHPDSRDLIPIQCSPEEEFSADSIPDSDAPPTLQVEHLIQASDSGI